MKKKWMQYIPIAVLAASFLTGCGGSGSTIASVTDSAAPVMNDTAQQEYAGGVAEEMVKTELAYDEEGGVTADQAQTIQQKTEDITLLEEKLVYHCNLDIETLDYPATIASIKAAISQYGGVIQSESENDSGQDWYYADYRKTSGTMHNYLQVRIPSKEYDNFLAELDGFGKIISKTTSVDNISQQYYDTTAQIEALQIQERNLLTMLEKCETIEDMITVEQRLSEVQYELRDLQTTRRYMDMDVAYSYVNISVSEVMEYRKDSAPVRKNTFADRLKHTIVSTGKGFLYFLEGLLFLLISLLPYILIITVIYMAFFHKKLRRIRENRRAEKAAHIAQEELRMQNMMQHLAVPREAEDKMQQETHSQADQNQPENKQQ